VKEAHSFPHHQTELCPWLLAPGVDFLPIKTENSCKTHISWAKWSLNTIRLAVFTNEVLISCQLLTEVKGKGLDEEGGVTLS